MITHFGTYIAGYGNESFLSQNNPVYFRSASLSSETPCNLNNYFNETASYNSATGQVSCSYISSFISEPRFVVYYSLTNGQGAAIQNSSSNSISLLLPIGKTL